MPRTFVSQPIIRVVTFTGPGDIVTNASAFWGVRAYSVARIGSNAVRLRRDSDNAESDFATIFGPGGGLGTGGLDTSAISSFKGGANLFVVKVYDQTGNGFDMTQPIAASQPSFSLTGAPNGTPSMSTTSSLSWQTLVTFTVAQPFSMSTVAKSIFNSLQQNYMLGEPGNSPIMMFNAGSGNPNTVLTEAGASNFIVAATDNVPHAIQAVYNNTNSFIQVDATLNGPSLTGTNGIGTQVVWADTGGGLACELGIWPVAFDSTQMTQLSLNQHNYYGF